MFLSLENNINGRPFLPTNSWRVLKQRLLRTLELALVFLDGTRCSNNQVPVFRLSTNPELISKFSQLARCIRPSYCRFSLKTPSLLFSLSPQWIPWIAFLLNDSSLENIWATSALFIGYFLKDFLGLFGLVVIYWATCSDPTFLGDHDPKYREVATCNLGSVWGCCYLSFFLHLVPSTSLTSNLFLTALPCCCLHNLFINNKIFRITFHFFWLCWVISSYFILNLT